MIGRRKFFGLIASTPLAAKAAAERAIADAVGVRLPGGPVLAANTSGGYPASANPDDTRSMASSFLRRVGVPDHHRRRIWDECRYPTNLDPDIACKRSWSMSVKILAQRQRDFERRLSRTQREIEFEDAQLAFYERFGFNWWF